jgi:hypothetical protein
MRLARLIAMVAAPMALICGAAQASPIPSVAVPPPPSYLGHPAVAHPVRGTGRIPHNPFMAANGRSEIHDDGWQTDVNTWRGPLGRNPQTLSSYIQRDCGSITFDRLGRVLSICIGASGPQLYMFDPNTLETLASYQLPYRNVGNVLLYPNVFQDYTGGGYFYLDNRDRIVAGTTTRHIYVVAETTGSPGFTLLHDYDLTTVLNSTEQLTSSLPDSHGLLWFVARKDGVVGTLNFKTGKVHAIHLGVGTDGEIENSFATDQSGGVYIATNRKLYRFDARRAVPKITWQITYPNSHESKPGQVDDGTGTTPTVMPGGYVNITDNADPMNLVVYRTARRLVRVVRRHHHRQQVSLPRMVCKVPIFSRGSSSDENSVISAGRSMIAENNYGYHDPSSVQGKVTAPGFVRVDINRNGRGCHRVWLNTSESAPTVVSKMALANGLIYTYTTNPDGDWYWTALDFRTGRAVYKIFAGRGLGYNNNYSGISISPRGTEYLGALGGILLLRDGS